MVKFTLFFLSLSFLIVLHEFGHYITARWFKARVDKFYLFFDFLFPFGNLMKFSLFKKKVGGTEYGIGWFPFGGYVDIAGMMADPEKPLEEPKPDEFRAKKPWQRLIILAGGITVNFLLGIIIYSMMAFAYGDEYIEPKEAKYGVAVDTVFMTAGLRDGDKILALDGKPLENILTASVEILIEKPHIITVERNGQQLELIMPDSMDKMLLNAADDGKLMILPQHPFVVDSLVEGFPAEKAGLKKGDSLISLNGDTLLYFEQFVKNFQQLPGKEITLGFYRDGVWMEQKLTLNEEGRMGVQDKSVLKYLKTKEVTYGFFESWGRGWSRTIEQLGKYIKQMRLIFSKEGVSKVGGFGSIASVFPSEWNWEQFWGITAMLSIILAFMNLLPIPVLDGGYILFVLWEMVTGKKVSDKFMQRALSIGMYLVLALLILANGNDIYRFLIK